MAKSNQWIHGGRYIKPTSPAANRPTTPRRAKTTDSTRTEERHALSQIWELLVVAIGHILPVIATIIKTIITFAVMMVGGIVYGIELARAKAVAIATPGKSKRQQPSRQFNQQQEQSRTSPLGDGIENSSQNVVSTRPTVNSTVHPNRSSSTDPLPSKQTQASSSASRATPAKSLLRKNSSRRDSFGSQQPRSARRVLFTETSEGEVHRTEVLYDKELPASARKVKVETKESLEVRVAASNVRRESFSPSKLVTGDQLRQATVMDSPNTTIEERSPLATVNFALPKNNQIIPLPIIKASPAKITKRPAESKAVDIHQKRRNLIAVSRYNRNTRRPTMGGLRPPNHGVNKRQREEVEHLVWNAMNKKGKVEGETRGVLDSKTPMKVRPGL